MKLARALMTFGAPSHRIESQLVAAARILEVDAEFIHLPNIFLLSFADPETSTSETHFIKCSGHLALGNLKMVHQIYRQVLHDEISAKRASDNLDALLVSKPIYPVWARCAIAFWLSVLICPLAFGGSLVDMFIAGLGALVLRSLQLTVVVKSQLYANVFEWVHFFSYHENPSSIACRSSQDQHRNFHIVFGSSLEQHPQRAVLLHGHFVRRNRLHSPRISHP
jgi:uncharacterized membrane protein YjjP (DUF1212 family)